MIRFGPACKVQRGGTIATAVRQTGLHLRITNAKSSHQRIDTAILCSTLPGRRVPCALPGVLPFLVFPSHLPFSSIHSALVRLS